MLGCAFSLQPFRRCRVSQNTRFTNTSIITCDVTLLCLVGQSPTSAVTVYMASTIISQRPLARTGVHLRPETLGPTHSWSEPLKWHTKLGAVSGKGNTSGEKEILPE